MKIKHFNSAGRRAYYSKVYGRRLLECIKHFPLPGVTYFTHFLLGSSYLQIFLKEFKMFMIVSTYSFSSLDPFKAKDKSAKGPILHNPGNLDLDGPANASTSEGPRNLIIPIEMLPSNRQTPQKDDTGR